MNNVRDGAHRSPRDGPPDHRGRNPDDQAVRALGHLRDPEGPAERVHHRGPQDPRHGQPRGPHGRRRDRGRGRRSPASRRSPTIEKALAEAKKTGIYSIIDMLNVTDPVALIRDLKVKPDIVELHRGIDCEKDGTCHVWGDIPGMREAAGGKLLGRDGRRDPGRERPRRARGRVQHPRRGPGHHGVQGCPPRGRGVPRAAGPRGDRPVQNYDGLLIFFLSKSIASKFGNWQQMDLLFWLNQNASLISLISNIILVIITGAYVYLTRKILESSRQQIELSYSPIIGIRIAGMRIHPVEPENGRRNLTIDLELANVGDSPALEVFIDSEIEFARTEINNEKIIPSRFEPPMIPYIRQSEVIRNMQTVQVFGNSCIEKLLFDFKQSYLLNIERLEKKSVPRIIQSAEN